MLAVGSALALSVMSAILKHAMREGAALVHTVFIRSLVTALFAGKLAWEHYAGALPFTAGSLSVSVVHEAHTYGAVGGVLAALWLARRSPQPASL